MEPDSTHQTFVEETLTSPSPCVLLHQLSPSSTCILIAGGFSRPIKTATETEKPLEDVLSSTPLTKCACMKHFIKASKHPLGASDTGVESATTRF